MPATGRTAIAVVGIDIGKNGRSSLSGTNRGQTAPTRFPHVSSARWSAFGKSLRLAARLASEQHLASGNPAPAPEGSDHTHVTQPKAKHVTLLRSCATCTIVLMPGIATPSDTAVAPPN